MAVAARRAAARVAGPGGAAGRRRLAVRAAAAGRPVRSGHPADPARRGVARGGVPAAGRRLRGDLRRRHRAGAAGDAEDPAADGRRAHLRRERAGGQARPDRGAVRQAALDADGRARPPVLPRRHGQRPRPDAGGPPGGPRPAAAGVPDRRLDAEPAARLRDRRRRGPRAGARLEQGLRPQVPGGRPLRAAGPGDRAGDGLHARLRGARRRAARGRAVRLARGAGPGVRAGADQAAGGRRAGRGVRPVRALPLDRRPDPGPGRRARRVRLPAGQPGRSQDRPVRRRRRWSPSWSSGSTRRRPRAGSR